MKNQTSTIKNRKSIKAFTLVECLVGLAISAMLLVAIAAAFNASLVNYGENEDMFHAINDARQAMARMTAQIRTAGYVDPNDDVWGVPYQATPLPSCTVYRTDESGNKEIIRFEWCDTDNKLYLIKGDSSTSPKYVLCDGVTNATFTTTTKNNEDATSVQISLTVTVQSGNVRRTLSGAAVIRRNLDS